ncbi:MAG: MOSC domain-containing protein [Acidobacteria bacterium]|nr:MOSC domain-containing protein [Acidobacteriota bacterium]
MLWSITVEHLTLAKLNEGLSYIEQSPRDKGVLELIVRRPEIDVREILEIGQLDLSQGLVGDNWKTRGSSRTPDKSSHPDMQLNIMNARAISVIAQNKEFWQLAGDQLFIDMDLSEENLPPGTKLTLGSAIIEITNQPHNGCVKFSERFGRDALKWVNSPTGKKLHLRGVNAKVIQPGEIKVGDEIRKV